MQCAQRWAILGLLVSLYSVYIEQHASTEHDFVALCDINRSVSCSKVLTSKYAKLLGLAANLPKDHPLNVSNTSLGLAFYFAVFVYPYFTFIPFRELLFFFMSCLSLVLCVILAYILYAILEDFCIVCVASYIINIGIFVCAYRELNRWSGRQKKTHKNKSI